MKILCSVHGKPAMVVGYGPGRKGRTMAIVITDGALRSVRLRDVNLQDVPQDLGKVIKIRETKAKASA